MEVYSKGNLKNKTVVTPFYENGLLIKTEEKIGGELIRSSELTYNTDGTVKSILDNEKGDKTLTSMFYLNGSFSYSIIEVI